MKLKIFKENSAQVNSYLLIKKKHAVLIDPGFNGKEIVDYCKESEILIDHVILTHGHYDHIRGIKLVSQEFNFDLYVSKQDKQLLYNDEFNYARAFGSSFKLPKDIIVKELSDKMDLKIFDETFRVYYTPGHTKGSICISYQKMLFTGDTLFYNSVGRTDLYSGNNTDIFKSLEILKKNFSNETTIYPGHGESGKMKSVKEINPYL
jgi:glyoxylase-like metal-dependent hydrolase (beta-lactamase superfamily II)